MKVFWKKKICICQEGRSIKKCAIERSEANPCANSGRKSVWKRWRGKLEIQKGAKLDIPVMLEKWLEAVNGRTRLYAWCTCYKKRNSLFVPRAIRRKSRRGILLEMLRARSSREQHILTYTYMSCTNVAHIFWKCTQIFFSSNNRWIQRW